MGALQGAAGYLDSALDRTASKPRASHKRPLLQSWYYYWQLSGSRWRL